MYLLKKTTKKQSNVKAVQLAKTMLPTYRSYLSPEIYKTLISLDTYWLYSFPSFF